MGWLLGYRFSVSSLLVFSIFILGLLSIQNMLLYNTVEHETFVQLKDDRALGESAVNVAVLSRFVNNDASRDIISHGRNAFRSQSEESLTVMRRDTVDDVKSDQPVDKIDLPQDVVTTEMESVNPKAPTTSTRGTRVEGGDEGAWSQAEMNFVSKGEVGMSSGSGFQRRKNLIIIGLSRSGTSYMCHMFNHDPQIFNIYEPMQMLTHWRETDHLKFNYKEISEDIIDGIVTCNYTANNYRRKFVADFSTFWRYRLQSNVFSSKPFCQTPGVKETCIDIDPKMLEDVCVNYYKHTVVKLTYSRLPEEGKIETLFSALLRNPDVDTRILHFVRDPRGNYNSRIKLGWIQDYPNPGLGGDAKKICSIVEKNILSGNNITGWMKEKYRMFRYVDMFTEPLKTAKEIYDFAGFDFPDSVKDWIMKTTEPSKEDEEKAKKNLMGLVRNSRENVEKWKKDAPPGRVKVIEENCKSLIQLMGHQFMYPLNNSLISE